MSTLVETVEKLNNKTASTEETENHIQIESGPSALGSQKGLAYTLASNIEKIQDMSPVAELTGLEMNERSEKPSYQISKLIEKLGGFVERAGFGKVLLNDYGVGGVINHRPLNRAKMVTLEAVPMVISQGRQISLGENWKGRGYDSYVFAAPVNIAGKTVYVAAVVDKSTDNKFYLNEVVDSNGNYIRINAGDPGSTKTGVTAQDGVTRGPVSPANNSIALDFQARQEENAGRDEAPQRTHNGGFGANGMAFMLAHLEKSRNDVWYIAAERVYNAARDGRSIEGIDTSPLSENDIQLAIEAGERDGSALEIKKRALGRWKP